ncbi:MAG TPA: Type 1 glutamine amidotransferase-like domain-containing protein [Candidatus Paceibacterota bacterium]
MKLLLTSGGITNKNIAKSLRKLLGKPFNRSTLVFIPTAANFSSHDKQWLIRDLSNCAKLGFKKINILNIDAMPQEKIWLPRLKEADVILIGGGNTFYLMKWLKKSGVAKALPGLLKKRIYVGISAGSIVTGPNLTSLKLFYGKDEVGQSNESLRMVDFHFRSHFNSPDFPRARTKYLTKIAKQLKEPLYALDDNSALQIIDGNIKVISEGKYLILNK